MTRLMIVMTSEEADALIKIATRELRDPREQMRVILRRELKRHGLLESTDAKDRAEHLPAQPCTASE